MSAMSVLIAGMVTGGSGLIGSATRASAADARPTDDPSREIFKHYCQACHTGAKPK